MGGYSIGVVIYVLLLMLAREIGWTIRDDDKRMRFMIASNGGILFAYIVFVICSSM